MAIHESLNESRRPSIAVVLCVNRANPWLETAIQSVLEQDDPDFEFLIAANACSDDLWAYLGGVAAADPRVRIFRSEIGQLAFNLNFLADQTSCDYLVRMDSDDVSEPKRLRTLRLSLSQEPVDILGSAVVLINGEGREVGVMRLPETAEDIKRAMTLRTVFCHPSVALRRQFLRDMRGYLGGFVSEDTDLWLRALRAGATMRNLSIPLLRYRLHENQSIVSRQGYAEVAGHWLRELILVPSWYTFRGFSTALAKALFAPILPGSKRYLNFKAKRQE